MTCPLPWLNYPQAMFSRSPKFYSQKSPMSSARNGQNASQASATDRATRIETERVVRAGGT